MRIASAGISYTVSDVFETFPRPPESVALDRIGRTLDVERQQIMSQRNLGLTKLYNLVNDPNIKDSLDTDVARMRQIQIELDMAAFTSYGWENIKLDHGFHTYRGIERWTIGPSARSETLDRLLEENQRRVARESDGSRTKRDRMRHTAASDVDGTLF